MKKTLFIIVAVVLALGSCGTKQDPQQPADGPKEEQHGEEEQPEVEEFEPSKEVKKRKAVIEEYTGVACQNCPDGHAVAENIIELHPNKVFAINIHTGKYSSNTYTTQYGSALEQQAQVYGYPSASINRHVFTEYSTQGGTSMHRGDFSSAVNKILKMETPVNIVARATIDKATRHLTVEVKGYYTTNSDTTTNKLNVALLQDSVYGYQAGMDNNPGQVENGQYRHMNMLRELITGQWGDDITPTTQGSSFSKTYEYDIPKKLGEPTAIDAVLNHLRVLVFVAEEKEEIYTICQAPITFK